MKTQSYTDGGARYSESNVWSTVYPQATTAPSWLSAALLAATWLVVAPFISQIVANRVFAAGPTAGYVAGGLAWAIPTLFAAANRHTFWAIASVIAGCVYMFDFLPILTINVFARL